MLQSGSSFYNLSFPLPVAVVHVLFRVRVLSMTHSPHGLVPDISPQFSLYGTHLTLTGATMSHQPVPEWA